METWWDYRTVWAAHRWLAAYFVIVILVFLIAILGTIGHNLLAILFVPSLAGAYIHHLMVMKRLNH